MITKQPGGCFKIKFLSGKAEIEDFLESEVKANVVSGDLIGGESQHTTNAFLFKRDSTGKMKKNCIHVP